MNVLKSVETTIANLVEGTFGRLFRSEVRPMELARKLAREMDEHRTMSVSRVYAPNEYAVWLSPEDRARYEGVEHEVIDELCAYLLEHARREELILAASPVIAFHTDERLALGEFGIQAQLVRPGGHSDEAPGRARCAGAAAGRRAWRNDDLQHLSARARTGRRGAGAAPDAGAASWSTGAACRSRRKARRSGAAATATSCSTTPASRAGTRRSGRARGAGRSPTSARPTACA